MEKPNYIFEVSWEVCNKVGGIHTVLLSKSLVMTREWEDRYIVIGPDVLKDPEAFQEFRQDDSIFFNWQKHMHTKGFKIRIGRWDVPGNPIAILIDFTTLYSKKNEIFKDLWLKYKLDSLTGAWDYIEPALFGYASGVIIECFANYHFTYSEKIVAHFHEWMTGVGLLYLDEHMPQIGKIFTTHATVLGRSIAGNGLQLYSKMDTYVPELEARRFNVIAKHSLEKCAAKYADCFTTVSEITGKECSRFLEKQPDIITPNGFDRFIVPDDLLFKEKRNIARMTLIRTANALYGETFPNDSFLIIQSGRYEYRNKGMDLLLKAIEILSRSYTDGRTILLFIFVPGHCTGPIREVQESLRYKTDAHRSNSVLTHHLQGVENDPVMKKVATMDALWNNDRIRIVYSPVYLDGNDGIYDLNYYELLIGFDLSVFPSYYEPWGYTPLESMAFHIPTITTNLSGIGMKYENLPNGIEKGIEILKRTDENDDIVSEQIAELVKLSSGFENEKMLAVRKAAHDNASSSLWRTHIENYYAAFDMALKEAEKRIGIFMQEISRKKTDECISSKAIETGLPVWRKIFVQLQIPEKLKYLEEISKNLWWTWNPEAMDLFSSMDPLKWEQFKHNPIATLNALDFDRLEELQNDINFISTLTEMHKKYSEYMRKPLDTSLKTAYFCMEYGLNSGFSIYSGGLGILAGDYLKQASDSCHDVTAIGLLYRHGYFRQEISQHGEQRSMEDTQKFTEQPLQPVYFKPDEWMKVSVSFPGRTIYAKVWKVEVGRVNLFLLDTDIPENNSDDRLITNRLYDGSKENRLKQEILLGIGGMRLLKTLNLEPDVYHFNEGHPAFAGIERIRLLILEENLSFDAALEVVRSSTLFTTHTPVPAGHDVFEEEFIRAYLSRQADIFNINWDRFMDLGRINPDESGEKFSMSILAIHLSRNINCVSEIHRHITKHMFSPLWEGFSIDEIEIGNVTNGVHLNTWTSGEWQKLLGIGPEYDNMGFIEKALNLNENEIWKTHLECKKELIRKLGSIISGDDNTRKLDYISHPENYPLPDEDTLIISFAKRMVTYKRPLLIFNDMAKLAQIIEQCAGKILFICAGKAHPNDFEAQEIIRKIILLSQKPQFKKHILYIPDYDMGIASLLVKGSDVWLNTPRIGHEASGTSGMKASMNGVLNLSMSDGWWDEVKEKTCGWTINSGADMNDQQADMIDSESLYRILEEEVIPKYTRRNPEKIPLEWTAMIRNAFVKIVPFFNTKRMLDEYIEKFYLPIKTDHELISGNKFESAKTLADWKHMMMNNWTGINIVSREVFDSINKPFPLGSEMSPEITIDIGEIDKGHICVEFILIEKRIHENDPFKIVLKTEMKAIQEDGTIVKYTCEMKAPKTGVFEFGFRLTPKHPLLKKKLDLKLIKWA